MRKVFQELIVKDIPCKREKYWPKGVIGIARDQSSWVHRPYRPKYRGPKVTIGVKQFQHCMAIQTGPYLEALKQMV